MDKELVTKQIWSRLTENELEQLDQIARKLDMTRSAAIRQAVIMFIQSMEGQTDDGNTV